MADSLYVAACTAWAAVHAVDAHPSETIAVSATAGGVGSIVVQLLTLRGVRVLGIASPARAPWLTAHGAVPVPYGDQLPADLTAAVPDGIDVFIDLFGPQYVQLAVNLGIPTDRIETIISFEKAAQYGTKNAGSADGSTREVLTEMAAHAASDRIEIPIAATYPLDRVRGAFTMLEQRHTLGKITLIP